MLDVQMGYNLLFAKIGDKKYPAENLSDIE